MNRRNAELPVYENKSPQRGVYLTFANFTNGLISYKDFEFKKGEIGDMLFVKENDKEFPIRNTWGYCDGQKFFINSGDKYSELVRSGYDFYFKGIKELNRSSELMAGPIIMLGPLLGGNTRKTTFAMNIRYYQLDMENGKIY